MERIEYGVVNLFDVWNEMVPMWAVHYEELAMYKDIPLKPDRSAYERMQAAGILRTYVVRVEGKLAAYFIAMLIPSPHYSVAVGIEDLIYVLPEHRSKGIGGDLVDFGESCLKAEGAIVVTHHVKVAHPSLFYMLKAKGYEPMDWVMTKRV